MYADPNIPSRYEALRRVAASFETQQAMADALGVTQPTVWRWLNQSRQLPVQYVLAAEHLTGVSRHWLRPDIYPAEHAGSPKTWNALHQRDDIVTFVNSDVSLSDETRAIRYAGAR